VAALELVVGMGQHHVWRSVLCARFECELVWGTGGVWMAAQGSVLLFLIIVWTYALLVNQWERQTTAKPSSATALQED